MSTRQMSGDYRPDIDGLRAIAVLAVMIFHGHSAALPGGFLGVDIFFVISGYLISKHIAAEVQQRRFSLIEFYRRRVRRIMPMMLVVVAVTLSVSLCIMTPEDGRAVAKSTVWSIASMANIHFWRDLDTGYFADSTAEVPLLHLWSLGVEEQFYIIWPLLLMFGVSRLRPPLLFGLMVILAGLSFELAAWVLPRDASFAYYMLPTRMGELLIGALVGVPAAIAPWRLWPRTTVCSTGWLGAACVAGSLWLIDSLDPFPGWLAVPPTLGAALIILAGEGGAMPLYGIASRPLVFVGRISYSAYLWHWPLFALFRYSYGEPGLIACGVIITLTLVLAWLSFEYVERPTRGTSAPFLTVALRHFALPACAVLLPALLVVYATRVGLPLSSAAYLQQLGSIREIARPPFAFDWVCQRQRLSDADVADPRCVLGVPGKTAPRAILVGDSNAAHYIPMLKEIAMRAETRFRNVAVGSCPPFLDDPRPYIDAKRVSDCVASTAVIRREIDRYPLIIIGASWTSYAAGGEIFFEAVEAAVRDLAARSKTIILLGKAPILKDFDKHCLEKILRVPFKTCPNIADPLSQEIVQVNARLRELAARIPKVFYFDANRYLCPDNHCSRQTADGQPRYLDAGHLSVRGSAELGRLVVTAEGVPAAFAALRSAVDPPQ